jgi:hypothetical protein
LGLKSDNSMVSGGRSQPYPRTPLLPCCLVASLPCCPVALLPCCLAALLPRCLPFGHPRERKFAARFCVST